MRSPGARSSASRWTSAAIRTSISSVRPRPCWRASREDRITDQAAPTQAGPTQTGTERPHVMTVPGAPLAFHVMAKPTGAVCNLDCEYCFFLSKEMLYPGSRFRMAADLQETYLRQLLEAHARAPEVVVAWQGGEPTMMGLEFFRRAIDLQRQYAAGAAGPEHHPDRWHLAGRRVGTVPESQRVPRWRGGLLGGGRSSPPRRAAAPRPARGRSRGVANRLGLV